METNNPITLFIYSKVYHSHDKKETTFQIKIRYTVTCNLVIEFYQIVLAEKNRGVARVINDWGKTS